MQPAVAVRTQASQIVQFMNGFTIETTPGSAAKITDFGEHLRPGTTVYITSLAGADFADTVAVARRLRAEGFNPVPHLTARSIRNRRALDEALANVTGEAGVTEALVIAGGMSEAVGEFTDSMQLLETGLFDRYGIHRIGVAGHPEGNPDIPEQAVRAALTWKNAFAARTGAQLYVVTQFCFEAEPIIRWDRALQAEGNRLPIHIGVPGLATFKTLIAHARACGVGPSMRFVTRHALDVARLLSVSAPDRLLAELAMYQAADPKCGIVRVHMYPLGGLKKSADWCYRVLDGEFTMSTDGRGFAVN